MEVRGQFQAWGKNLQYPLDRRPGGPGLDVVDERKSQSVQELNPSHPVHSLVFILTELLGSALT
jgi:hypothetical protein